MLIKYRSRFIRHLLLTNQETSPDHARPTSIFAHVIYKMALIPTEWKTLQIFPIPKPYDWQFCLEKTRSIILLECLRKIIVRIINTRLADLCLKHNILRGLNFGGLPGGNTKTPIHVLHNIMEDAKSQSKELWVAF